MKNKKAYINLGEGFLGLIDKWVEVEVVAERNFRNREGNSVYLIKLPDGKLMDTAYIFFKCQK